MTNNGRVFRIFVLVGCLTVSASAQPGLFSSGAEFSRAGWKFSYSTFAKPTLAGQDTSIHTNVTHTDARDGRAVIFHRLLIDPMAKIYCAYDVAVEPLGDTRKAAVRFQPFSLRANQLPKEYEWNQLRPLELPQFPEQTFQSEQIIAVDLLSHPQTGQRIVDYLQISFEPHGEFPVESAPRDFQASDVLLHVVYPSLRLNAARIPSAPVSDRVISRKLVWVSVPGHGRFLLSLAPYPGYPFQKAGMVRIGTLSFSWNGDRYELRMRQAVTESSGVWNLYVLPARAATQGGAAEFSYGAVDSVEEFLSKAP